MVAHMRGRLRQMHRIVHVPAPAPGPRRPAPGGQRRAASGLVRVVCARTRTQ